MMSPSQTESSPQMSTIHPSPRQPDNGLKNDSHASSVPQSINNSPGDSDVKAQVGESKPCSTAQTESRKPHSLDEPLYPYREGYTRKLIRMKYITPDKFDGNFDEAAWIKEAYDENVIVVDMHPVPKGWILVDGMLYKA